MANDKTDAVLARMIEDFSVENARMWLSRKFASFDKSNSAGLSIDKNKNEQKFFNSAKIIGYIKELPESSGSSVNRPVLVAVVELRGDLTERTSRQTQFNFAKRILQDKVREGVVGLDGYPSQGIFFFYDKDQFFRISLVSGSVEGRRFKFNEAKRQSFYINPDRPNNVARSRLLEPIKTFADLKEAFSVETLTKEFYSKLFDWYEWAMNAATGVYFPNNLSDNSDDSKYNNESIIRLITRLMFTWFIRQRGMVSNEFFTIDGVSGLLKNFNSTSMDEDNYYRAILQNLFFATLNCHQDKRAFRKISGNGKCSSSFGIKTQYRYEDEFKDSKQFLEVIARVPFLNCALFDCLDKQEREQDGGRTLLFDGFSDVKKRQAHIPNGLFFDGERGIIKLFDTYEFTIDENNADDADIALDPELLGKVFENLLGAFNPETKETARKSTGSFYTPREIVDYMVEESLKNHLKTKVPALTDEHLEDLFDKTKAVEREGLPFSDKIAGEVREALYSCKIIDPACGSGAFPMGILHCMVRLFSRLDPNNCDLNNRLIKRYKLETNLPKDPLETESERKERLEALNLQLKEGQHYPDYARKLYLIENCIYGVDIQPIATQISKLRFFISLLCDQLRSNWNENVENHGLLSLPNLEAKFVCANTLISLPETEGELELATSGIMKLREKLQENRHRIFTARTYATKDKLKLRDLEIRDQIREKVSSTLAKPDKKLIACQNEVIRNLKEDRKKYEEPRLVKKAKPIQASLFGEATQEELSYEMVDLNQAKRDEIDEQIRYAQKKIDSENAKSNAENVTAIDQLAKMVAGWDPYDQNATSEFFDPKWMFNIEDGFDIVIGNPPYVQLQENGGELGNIYKDCNYETFVKTGDVYSLFYERGYCFLKNQGCLCYITSNKWMRSGYGEKTRKFFAEKTNPILLVDFRGQKIFESATVDTNVILFSKETNAKKTKACIAKSGCREDVRSFVNNNSVECCFDSADSWVVLSEAEHRIKEKIESVGVPLKDWDIQINYGIKTGCNEAFIIDEKKRKEILANCKDKDERKRTDELIRKILKDNCIEAFSISWNGRYIINFHNGYMLSMGHLIRPCKIEDYPAIKRHIDIVAKELESGKRKTRGGHKGSNKGFFSRTDCGASPYNLRSCSYVEAFNKPKLIWKQTGILQTFALDIEGFYLDISGQFLWGKDINEEMLLYLNCILNSKLSYYWFVHNAIAFGDKGVRWIPDIVYKFPVPQLTEEERVPLVKICKIIIDKKKNPTTDTSALEVEINKLVYKLYGLTEEEIAIVEGHGEEGGKAKAESKPSRRAGKAASPATVNDDEEELE